MNRASFSESPQPAAQMFSIAYESENPSVSICPYIHNVLYHSLKNVILLTVSYFVLKSQQV